MTIGSCSDFHTQVNKLITAATPAALHITAQAPGYSEASALLASIVNRQRSFIATASLADTDRTRDNAGGVISNVVGAYLTSPVAEKREAAMLLSPQLSAYKGIRNHEYTKQTAEVKGMLAVLDETENAAAVATLGLTEEVEALREANAAFEAKFLEKTEEMSARMDQRDISSKDTVAEANALYQDIVQTVNAYAIVQPSDEINTFIASVNGLVGTYSSDKHVHRERERAGGHVFVDCGQRIERRLRIGRRHACAGTRRVIFTTDYTDYLRYFRRQQ